ncbi:MAG: MFS transporter [Actinobacteria bacterium]|nr:MFS transporter [Actinomycetota bacterium]
MNLQMRRLSPAVWYPRWRHTLGERLRAAVGGGARLRVVLLLAGVLGLSAADSATVGAIAAELKGAFGVGNAAIGLLVTVSVGAGALATLPFGMLVDRVNRIRLLSVVILLWCAAMVACGAAVSYPMLLACRLGLGVVVAAAFPAVASLLGDLFPAAERGRIYGFVLTGELVGAAVGLLVSGNVAAVLSWRVAFWLLALPGLVLAWALRELLPEPARGGQSRLPVRTHQQPPQRGSQRPDGQEGAVTQEIAHQHIHPHQSLVLHHDPTGRSLWWVVRYLLSIRTNVVLIIASALGYFFFSGIQTFAVVYMRERFGLPQAAATSLTVVLGAGSIAGVLTAGRISDHLLAHHRISARPVVAGAAFLLVVAAFVAALLTPVFVFAAPLLFLGAAGLGAANPPLDAARLDIMHFRLWGRAESVRTVLRSALVAIAPLLFGYLSARWDISPTTGATGLQRTFLVMLASVLAAGLILIVFARRTYPRDVATAIASQQTDQARSEPGATPSLPDPPAGWPIPG